MFSNRVQSFNNERVEKKIKKKKFNHSPDVANPPCKNLKEYSNHNDSMSEIEVQAREGNNNIMIT